MALIVLAGGVPRLAPRWLEGRTYLPGADADEYVLAARTFVSTGSFELPPRERLGFSILPALDSPYRTPYAMTTSGRLFPKHPLAYSLLLAPGVGLAGTAGALAMALVFGATLAAFLAHRAARFSGFFPGLVATLAVSILTPAARETSWGITVDTLVGLAFVAAVALAADGHSASAGVVAGLSLFLRPTMPLLLLPVPFLVFASGRLPALRRLLAGAAGPALAYFAVNTVLWGAPWRSSYERSVILAPGGGLATTTHSATFDADWLAGLRILLGVPDGLLAAAPIVLVAGLAFFAPSLRRLEWLAAWGAALVAYLMLAPYRFVHELPAHACRFAFPLVVASCLPLAALIRALERQLRTTTSS